LFYEDLLLVTASSDGPQAQPCTAYLLKVRLS
jgi:hypothetical protein